MSLEVVLSMLTITGKNHRFCDGLARRSFLRLGGLSLGGMTLPDLLRANARSEQAAGRHKAIIMVFLPGGPSHQDIWDLKPQSPAEFRGEFSPIDTCVPGIQICEHLPLLARRMDRFALIRSLVGGGPSHASEICFSGYDYLSSVQNRQPSLGAAVSRLHGAAQPGVPPFVSFCQPTPNLWRDPGRAGYLGPGHLPFLPEAEGMRNMVLRDLTLDRLGDRRQLLTSLDQFRNEVDQSGVMDSVDTFQRQALEVLTSSRFLDAMDLQREDPAVRARYGRGSMVAVDDGAPMFNEHFLLARRAVEAGVRCVTLSFGRWDTHSCRKAGQLAGKNNFAQLREYLPELDRVLSTLVDDLYDRGLQDDVSVVVWGEFGRTPRINPRGGRDHWPAVSGCLLAGGGMQTGQVIGSTTSNAEEARDRPVDYQEVFATLYHGMGIDVSSTTFTNESGRPVFLLDRHRPIPELVG